jgi:hypothetical protein
VIPSQITKQYEMNDLPAQELDRYERKLKKSESVLSVIEVIYAMFIDLMTAQAKKAPFSAHEKTFSSKTKPKDLFSSSSEVSFF